MKKILATLCLPLQLLAGDVSDLVPREALFRKSPCLAIKLSPDGRLLSFIGSDKEGTLNVFVTSDLSLKSAKQITHFTEPTIKAFHWSPDGKKILFLKDKDGTRQFRLYSVDTHTLESKDLTSAFGSINAKFFQIDAKQNKALIGINSRNPTYHDLYLLDFANDSLSLIYQNDAYANFVIARDLGFKLKMRLNEDCTVSYLDKDDKLVLNLSAEDAFHTEPIGFFRNSLFLLDTRNSDTTQLVKITGTTQEILGHDKDSDLDDFLFENGELVAYASYYLFKNWVPVNERIKQDLDFLTLKLSSNFSVTDCSYDYTTWIVKTNLPEKGEQFWLYDRPQQKLTELYCSEHPDLLPMHPIVIPARDGLSLVSYLTLPKKRAEEGVPLVVIPHGGPFLGRDYYQSSSYHQWLANRGYAVLSVNFRLSSGFGKSHVVKGNGEWGKKAHEDILDAVQWCIDQKIVDKNKVAVFGASYGGYEALASLAFSSDVFACAVAICGPSSLKTVLDKVPLFWETPKGPVSDKMKLFTKNAFLVSIQDSPSPIDFVDRIKKPLLLIHGENDPIVASSESDQIYEALLSKEVPVHYLRFPDEGHGIEKFANGMCALAAAEKLFADVLGGSFEPLDESVLQRASCNPQR
jgi:dipeptidyl aminopeptidase/acylaminoacyl peptidase